MKLPPAISASTLGSRRLWRISVQWVERQFLRIMHAQGRDAIEFYTEKKIVASAGQKNTAKF